MGTFTSTWKTAAKRLGILMMGKKNKQPDNSYLKYYPELDFFLFYFLLFAPMLHDGLRRDDIGTFF